MLTRFDVKALSAMRMLNFGDGLVVYCLNRLQVTNCIGVSKLLMWLTDGTFLCQISCFVPHVFRFHSCPSIPSERTRHTLRHETRFMFTDDATTKRTN
jgi:hypothetical protein